MVQAARFAACYTSLKSLDLREDALLFITRTDGTRTSSLTAAVSILYTSWEVDNVLINILQIFTFVPSIEFELKLFTPYKNYVRAQTQTIETESAILQRSSGPLKSVEKGRGSSSANMHNVTQSDEYLLRARR